MNKNEFLRWYSLEEFKNLKRFYNKKEVFLLKIENFKKQHKEEIAKNFFGDESYKNNFGYMFDEDGDFLCICKMYKNDYKDGWRIYYGVSDSFLENSLIKDFYKDSLAKNIAAEFKKLLKKEVVFLKRYEIKKSKKEIEKIVFRDVEKLFL